MGTRAGYWVLCYRNFPFQTQTAHSSMWPRRGLTETPGGPAEIISFYPEACGQVLGEACLDLVQITLGQGMRMTATESPQVPHRVHLIFRELPKMSSMEALNLSVPQFPKSENRIKT